MWVGLKPFQLICINLGPTIAAKSERDPAFAVGFMHMPQQPVDTFFATTNQRIHGNDYPHFISGEWAHPGRKLRVDELLAAKAKHDAQSLREIQHDLKHTHDRPLSGACVGLAGPRWPGRLCCAARRDAQLACPSTLY